MPHARTPSPEVRKEFGRRLAAWRKSYNPVITQAQAADLLSEVSEPVMERTWSRWEQGATAPLGRNLEAVIELTGIEISDLFGPRHEGTVSRKWLEEQFQELHRRVDELQELQRRIEELARRIEERAPRA